MTEEKLFGLWQELLASQPGPTNYDLLNVIEQVEPLRQAAEELLRKEPRPTSEVMQAIRNMFPMDITLCHATFISSG